MWELDYKASWAPKNWCFRTVVLEKTLESPSDCKEIQPVNPKGSQSWMFIGRTDAEAETPILWPPHAKSWLIWKDPDAGWVGARGEGDDRGWDGWMSSLTRWTWVWVNSGSWWWTGRPGVLRFMGSQRVRHDWATDLIWCYIHIYLFSNIHISFTVFYDSFFKDSFICFWWLGLCCSGRLLTGGFFCCRALGVLVSIVATCGRSRAQVPQLWRSG